MGCVNKSSKEFKDLAARNNLADNTLELITHKYWLETGNETLFPTDVYIQAQLGNTQYQESGKSVRELWGKMYSTPQEFHSLSELQAARKEASRFFPQSAIVHYRNAMGNYVLSVKRPVEQANYDKDDFFNEFDNIGSMRDIKKLNLDITTNQTYTISKVQELYNWFNDDRTSKALADKVFSIAKDLGIEVLFNETLPFGIMGRYTNSNIITYKKSFLEKDIMTNKKASIILHEVLHSISMYALSNKTKNWKRPEALQEFHTEINSLYQGLKNNPLLKGERGVVDVFEFVAELANPIFRSKIQEIDKQNKANKSFWSRILDAFKALLGLHTSDTYYQRSMNALDKALNAFDIDTYMRYNGIKSQLRKEVANNTINQTNQRLENKKLVKYDKAIKSAGRVFESTFNLIKDEQQRMGRGSKEKTSNNQSLRKQLHEKSLRQQKELINWATKHKQLIVEPNDYYEEALGDSAAGSETRVWKNNDKGTVVKNISLNHYGTPKALMNRILIHNLVFPTTAMKMLKVGASDNGISIIVEQPFIEDSGIAPTMDEIKNYMLSLGFTLSKGKGINAEYTKDGYLVTDIRPENVIKQPDGSLAVIDCFAKFEDESMGNNIMGDVENQAQRFIDSMSSSQLKDETNLIKQESADYDLINGIEPKPEHSGKAVPQDFTFADGTKVKAPFKPNAQQIDALNEMDRFMKSNETSMTLSGYAGTGKTSLMEMIAQKGKKQYRPVVFCATTNKAAAVLNERVSKAGFKAATLNKVFGISVEVDSKSNTYNARNLVNVLKDADITPGTTVIIDEASMINEENYGILNNIAKQNDLKIIYVGDSAQLAPVGEDKISKVFRNGEGKVITLTQVERTDDNAILKEATELRNGNPLSGVSSFNDKGEGVAYISPNHQDEINNIVAHYVKGLKHNSNYFRILAFTNKAVSTYNNQVRELLGYTSPIPQVGEPMTGYNNWGYEWKTKSYRFINSESYKVSKVDKSHKITTNLNDGTAVTMEIIPLTLEDSLGNIDTFNFIDIKSNPSNLQAAIQLANEKKMLWAEAKHAVGRDAKAKIYQRINFIDNFLFVNDNIEDSNHNLLQAKTIDFGYAMTVHKSQGSTFINVLMDDVDISRAGLNSNNAMEVVDLGEVDNNVASSANFTGDAEDVDLGFSNNFSTTPSTKSTKHIAPTQTINLKQQLEYVGVSRATDTVTIVSNNVKKEGSPLHPTKEVKEDKVNSNTTRLNITSANSVDKKAAIKGAMANKFIGFADGIFNSSTGKYAQQAGDKANTGNYTSDDVVFVSIPGKRGNEDVRHQQQDRTIAEALKALKAGATLLTDNKAYTENSTYNEGEKRLAKALNDAGAVYSEIQKDNQTIGVWTISTNNSRSNNKIENNESNNTRNAETVAGKQQTSNGGLLAESQARIQRGDGNLRETQEQGTKPLPQVSQLSEEVKSPTSDTKINIYAGTNENADLSNFADRPFVIDKQLLNELGIDESSNIFINRDFNTVEGAFQGMKLAFVNDPNDINDADNKLYKLQYATGSMARNIGRNIKNLDTQAWNANSSKIMKALIKASFSQNPDAAQRLIDTGDATLTHTQDESKWSTEFPRILMEVREELKKEKGIESTEQLQSSSTLTLPEGSVQQVSLPGYEYFNDLYEDTPVDAAWKIPYLKELDAQISDENSIEDNQNIINHMDNILQSTSEKEYLQESKNSEKKQVEKTLDEYDKLNRQIDNLLGNQDLESDGEVYHLDELGVAHLSASEIRHTAELVANEISDSITKLQKEEGLAEKLFPILKTDLDFKSASRKQIVEAIGINRLIDSVKSIFDTEANWDFYKDDENGISFQADLIFDNWDAIMYLAADVFAMNEGFGIAKDFSKGNFTTTEDSHIDYDNFNDYSNDQDIAAEEGEKDEQEHWQIESRTIDVLNSMSALVRQGIHECYLLNADSSKVMSKWGIAERVNPREAVNSILRWTQGSLSLNDMIKKLSDKQSQNPWLSQLVQRLSDKSGSETDFQSQFYGVFSKHFQPYSVVLLEDGKYHSIAVNSHPALTDVMNTITSQFKIGEHPLFGINGKVNTKLLGSANSVSNDFTLHKALSELQNIDKSIKQGNTLDDKMSKVASDNIMAVCRAFGYNITEDMLSGVVNVESINKVTSALNFIVKDLDSAASAQHKGEMKDYNPFAFGTKFGINGSLRNFLSPITDKLEDTAVNAFYDSGKMYQSYVTPSFMTKLFNKFRQEGQAFEDFILDEYGSSEWFKFGAGDGDITKGWRNEWLRLLARDENARKVFDHKVELNFNKHNYMRNMSDAEYTLSLITEYFSESAKVEDRVPAWYRVPMQSNKPSSEFIKFYSYRGDGYKNAIVNGLHNMFLQEISRIQTVLRRNMSKNDPGFIKNFDTNGRKFNFLPVFNSYLDNVDTSKRTILRNEDGSVSSDNNRFASLLQKKVNGEINLTPDEEVELSKLAERVIRQSMENRVQFILDTWESNGILEAAKNIKDIYPSEFDNSSNIKNEEREGVINDWVRKQVENFLWNDSFASKNILQLTLSDIAFYKDTEDLQKRLAQLHAPGVRGNINAIDYDGNRVSDGKYRTFILQDFDSFKSNIIANITEVFDRRIAAAPDNQKAAMIALKESLVGKDGKYTKINVTDAQGYSSPSSYRKKAYIFGKWSRHAEDIYQKMLKGEYTYTDLETAFQPLKPFVYSKLTKNMGVDNAPIHSMQVPFQAKNAEYLLIMADAILKGEKLSRPNLLRAVYRVMEDSERLMPTKGIDTVQFESSIKSGLQGKMNIYQFRDIEGGEDAAYTFMMNQIFKEETDATGERVYKNYNTNTFVHETSFEDYCLQQEVPEHFKEHSQAHGSQIRMITPSDLDLFTTDENGQQVDNFYEWTEPDGTVKRMKADEFRKEYEQTIADNIEESIDNLSAELHLNSEDKRERNIALSKILQREVLSSPRYGIDLVQACSIDKETGEFRIPKGDPIQAKRIEQLINSVIKNRVNKQKIAGGPIVQVSNFGTSKQLHIRFNDKQGNLIPLEEEYVSSEHDGLSYKDYLKKNQGGIAYFEVFCPIWSNELFDKFSNANGSINVDAINTVDPELLKMVSYRIPTEDKYSCAPMKVVGFMPREAGDAIMLPYELTEIDDSDFDVDKRYVMRKDIPIKTKRRKDIESELFKRASESYAKAHNGKTNNQWIGEQVRMFLDNPQKMKSTDKFMQWLYGQYQQVAYYTDAPIFGRTYRDNKIIDMTYAVLTNQMTADKILNPGGFDAPKKMGYMVAAYKNPANKGISWNALQGMSIDELKKLSYTDKDLTFADTQVQFYKQNSAAASLIGVFAVNKVAHATLESNDIFLDVSEICGNDDFTIAGTTFGGRMQIDQKYDREGTLIGKTLGSLVSASADAVKDPILNLMNVNMTTAGMLNTMLRLGMTFNDAALFLSQDVIERLLSQFNRDNLTNYVSLDGLINKWLDIYRQKYNISDSSNINTEPLSTEELVNGLTSEEHEATDYKVLLAFQKMRSLTDAMRKPTYATRFNSISSAVGPLIIDNLIIEHKMSQFIDANTDNGTHFYTADDVPVDIDDIFFDHPVLKQFARTVDIAKSLFSDMPAGSVGFRNLLAQLPKDIADKMYGDKKLLDQFSNFYQSYLLVQSGVIDSKNLKDYATAFPKWFMEQNFKDEFPNNELIQAIRMNVSKKTGHPYLTINITGMDEQRKEELRSAWIDLHKADPKLSKMLFDYSFFRAGIGFSPKTFMALVPTYVKERLMNENTGASYVDTYRHFPTVVPKLVINQFIRNNWDNTKLVPWKGGKDTHYNVNLKTGELRVYRPEEIADLTDVSYMKTKVGKETYLWHLETSSPNELTFKRVKPLGNNGEYLEISTSEIVNPLSDTSSISENKITATVQESATDLKTESHQESSAEESVKTPVITKTEEVKNLSAIADLIMLQNPKLDHEGAEKLALEIKDKEKMFRKFLQKVFKHKGLDLNEDEAIDEFHKYC
jgi:exodeoxyribonuclease-5